MVDSEFNEEKISLKLGELYNKEKINKLFILNYLHESRVYITHYIGDAYCLETLSPKNQLSHNAVDESIFSHLEGEHIWVLGMINNETNAISLDI